MGSRQWLALRKVVYGSSNLVAYSKWRKVTGLSHDVIPEGMPAPEGGNYATIKLTATASYEVKITIVNTAGEVASTSIFVDASNEFAVRGKKKILF